MKAIKKAAGFCAKPFIWYLNRSAKTYEELFKGVKNIPYFL